MEAITGVLAPLNDPAYFIEVTVDPEAGTLGLTALACTPSPLRASQGPSAHLLPFCEQPEEQAGPGRAGRRSEERPGWMQEDVQVALVEGSEDIGGSESPLPVGCQKSAWPVSCSDDQRQP